MEETAAPGFDLVGKLLELTLLGTEWVLWLLIILSVVSVAIIIERIWYYQATHIDVQEFSRRLVESLVGGRLDDLKSFCEAAPSIEAQVVAQAIAHQKRGARAVEESMNGYLIGVRHTLDRGLVVLGTLGNNAPFIGLFGTVMGIIQAFHSLSLNPAGGPSVVMAGISEALVATAVGLVVAIPAVIAFNAFQRVVKRRIANAEAITKLVATHLSGT